jgi:hypothetical protein
MEAIGRRRWAIAEGYIPSESSFNDRALISHETACILNASDRDARVEITILFADREPAGPYKVTVGARRTLHLRFNDLKDPKQLPRDTDYASLFESTCRSSCSTRGSTRVAPSSRCSRPWPIRRVEAGSDFTPHFCGTIAVQRRSRLA